MKKIFLVLMGCMASFGVMAQDDSTLSNGLDESADSTVLTSINDIINERQEVSQRLSLDKHFNRVWGYRSFVNFVYHSNATLTPDGTVATGVTDFNGGVAPEYKAKLGLALQVGRNYRLHKRPIANVAQFNLDFTGFDLSYNKYEAETGNNGKVYLNTQSFNYDGKDYFYIPWNIEKHELNYGMSIGPSLTIAPFTYAKGRELHYLKLNGYFHLGYNASAIFMKYDEKNIVATEDKSKVKTDENCFLWGHGVTTSFGGNISWRNIGVGFEHRSGKLEFQSFSTDKYSKVKNKFKAGLSRLYFQIRW